MTLSHLNPKNLSSQTQVSPFQKANMAVPFEEMSIWDIQPIVIARSMLLPKGQMLKGDSLKV
jgi:hypothetical protein